MAPPGAGRRGRARLALDGPGGAVLVRGGTPHREDLLHRRLSGTTVPWARRTAVRRAHGPRGVPRVLAPNAPSLRLPLRTGWTLRRDEDAVFATRSLR